MDLIRSFSEFNGFLYLCLTKNVKTEAEIITLSGIKLKAAEVLLKNGFADDAYYLAGYSLELLLKAKICKTLLIPDFFDFDNARKRKLYVSKTRSGDRETLYKPFKVHDYEQLIILSGLYGEFSKKTSDTSDLAFTADWSIVSNWDENLRYLTGSNKADVESFIASIKNINKWLTQFL